MTVGFIVAKTLIIKRLKLLLSGFNKFKVKMWLDKQDGISLYIIEPLANRTKVNEVRYMYDDVIFCRYSFNKKALLQMISELNTKGFYKEDFFINKELVGILNVNDFEQLNPGNIEFKAVGDFYEGDYTPYYNIVFNSPTHFIFFNTKKPVRYYFSSESRLFNKSFPYFPTKALAFRHLMEIPMKRQQENISNGIMFFIPLSSFLVTKLEIIGDKLVLHYNEGHSDLRIRVKIYYQNKYSGTMDSIDEGLTKIYHLSYLPTYVDLIAYNDEGKIVDKLIFDFDPRLAPERGRIKFVLTDDYIQDLIKNGENEEVEFKGFQNLVLKTPDKDGLTETLVAFANKLGGIIILGVNDDKKIIGFKQGVSIESIRKQLINLILDWCEPQIDILVNDIDMQNGERLLLIHVNKGNNPPYIKVRGRSGIFIRINDSDRFCNRSRFDEFMKNISKGNYSQLLDYDDG
jgi:hypothetical protein